MYGSRSSALRRRLGWDAREQTVLIGSLLKWTALGSLAGLAAGSASALFLRGLELVTETRQSHPWLIWLLPVGGLAVGWLYASFGKEATRGNNLILDELHDGKTGVPLRMAPFVLVGTWLTHLLGGSTGREGTAVQMGGSLADFLARRFALRPADRQILLAAGVAGGFGSVFGTPLAGAVFAMEVTQVGGIRYGALIATFAASLVGDLTTRAWGVGHAHYPALTGIGLSALLLAKVALLGLAAGLAGRLFADAVHGVRTAFSRSIAWAPLRPAIGGAILALILFSTGAFAYAGLGMPLILQSFTGDVPALAFLWKLALTALTLGAGFQGGEVTPLFFIGSTLGATLGHLLNMPAALAAGAGFVAVFAGAANTPLACIIMGAELFGGGALPYLGAACIVAYITSGHAGIYTSQRVAIPKSKSLPVGDGTTLGHLRPPGNK